MLSGERAEDTFHGRRQRVLPALERAFDVQRRHRIPPGPLWMYTAVRATSR